jgi:hypothetical protein
MAAPLTAQQAAAALRLTLRHLMSTFWNEFPNRISTGGR